MRLLSLTVLVCPNLMSFVSWRARQGDPANLSNIQEQMIKPMSNTSRLVDKLIDKGWVSRDMCKYNRRKVEIFITENGLNALQQLDNLVVH